MASLTASGKHQDRNGIYNNKFILFKRHFFYFTENEYQVLNHKASPNLNTSSSNQASSSSIGSIASSSKLNPQKINHSTGTSNIIIPIIKESHEEPQNLFNSNSNLSMQGISGASNSKKIKFDLKPNHITGSSSHSISLTQKTPPINPGISFMNFNPATSQSNKIIIANSAVSSNSCDNMHKQLNYQILKTISNKNNPTTTSGGVNPLSATMYSNISTQIPAFKSKKKLIY